MSIVMRTIQATAISTLAMASLALGADNKAAELFPKYKVGDTATYSFEMTRNEKTVMTDQPALSRVRTITQNATFEMKVAEASESGTTINLTLKDVNCKIQDPGKAMEFNSSKPADDSDAGNELIKTMRPIVGSALTFKFDANGNLVSATSQNELVKVSQYTDIARQLVGEQWARVRWTGVFFPKPNNAPTNVGEKWESSYSLDAPAQNQFATKMTYSLDSANTKQAVITGKGKYELTPVKGADQNIFNIKDSSLTNSMSFDPAKNCVTASESNEKVDLLMSAQGVSVSRSSETQVKITRKN